MNKVWEKLSEKVPAYPLALFRIIFGLLLTWSCINTVHPLNIRTWNLVSAEFYQKYPLALWFPEPNLIGLKFALYTGLILSVFLTVGFLYRFSSAGLVILYGYYVFLDQGHYNNHYYLIWLFLIYFTLTNAHQIWSLDSKLKLIKKDLFMPYWMLFLFQFQVWILYTYGGINKINKEWLNGYPLIYSLQEKEILTNIAKPLSIAMSWGGMIFDTLNGFWLFSGKWLGLIFGLNIGFHLTNHWIYNDIGIFPFLGLGLLILFIPKKFWIKENIKLPQKKLSIKIKITILIIIVLQLLIPARHWIIKGDFRWTTEGGRLSWTMKASSRTNWLLFYLTNPETGEKKPLKEFAVKFTEQDVIKDLAKHNFKNITVENGKFESEFLGKKIDINTLEHPFVLKGRSKEDKLKTLESPYNVWRAALFLERKYQKKGIKDPVITVEFLKTINNHPPEYLIDPNVDLTKVKYSLWHHNDWILLHSKLDYGN